MLYETYIHWCKPAEFMIHGEAVWRNRAYAMVVSSVGHCRIFLTSPRSMAPAEALALLDSKDGVIMKPSEFGVWPLGFAGFVIIVNENGLGASMPSYCSCGETAAGLLRKRDGFLKGSQPVSAVIVAYAKVWQTYSRFQRSGQSYIHYEA